MEAASRIPSIASRREAEDFLASLEGRIDALSETIEVETAHLSAGRLRQGLAVEPRKAELAAAYMLGLQAAKGNAVALARFAPAALAGFRARHARFAEALERNQAVVATAKAVSEGLVKSLSEELDRERRPTGYGAGARGEARAGGTCGSGPLVFSGRF